MPAFRVDLRDPFEHERQQRAKEAAAKQSQRKRKQKSKTSTPTAVESSKDSVAASFQETVVAPAEASLSVRQKTGPRPKKNTALSENASEVLRHKVELLPEGEKQQEIARLNTLSPEELMEECKHAEAGRPSLALVASHWLMSEASDHSISSQVWCTISLLTAC